MQERQVTVGGTTTRCPSPFFVLATQNPIEQEGTYPLPEAQLDRFEVLRRTTIEDVPHAQEVITPEELIEMRRLVREVIIAPHVEEMAADILLATHPTSDSATETVRRYVRYGASPRGAQAMVLTAKARALLAGRYNVSTGDVIAVARPSLRHRIIRNFEGEADGISTDEILDEVLNENAATRTATRPREAEPSRA
jgi:MoxR-like ATPase